MVELQSSACFHVCVKLISGPATLQSKEELVSILEGSIPEEPDASVPGRVRVAVSPLSSCLVLHLHDAMHATLSCVKCEMWLLIAVPA